jgi:hypothetical protein
MNPMTEPYGFIQEIRDQYLVQAQVLNERIDQIFEVYNKTALSNIEKIMTVVSSEIFMELVRETDEIVLYFGTRKPIQEHNEKLKTVIEDFIQNPKVNYYWKALSSDIFNNNIEVRAGLGYIEINSMCYYTISELYESTYRFFFYDFDYSKFVQAVRQYLKNIGLESVAKDN